MFAIFGFTKTGYTELWKEHLALFRERDSAPAQNLLNRCAAQREKLQEVRAVCDSIKGSNRINGKIKQMMQIERNLGDIEKKALEKLGMQKQSDKLPSKKTITPTIPPTPKTAPKASSYRAIPNHKRSLTEKTKPIETLGEFRTVLTEFVKYRDNAGDGSCFYISLAVGLLGWIANNKNEHAHPSFVRSVERQLGVDANLKEQVLLNAAMVLSVPANQRKDLFLTNEHIIPLVQFLKQAIAQQLKTSYAGNWMLLRAKAEADQVPPNKLVDFETFTRTCVLDWHAQVTAPLIAEIPNIFPECPFMICDLTKKGKKITRVDLHFPHGSTPQVSLIRPGTEHYVLAYKA